MPIAAEFVEPFILVYGAFKSSVDNLIPIMCFLLWKKTESMGYDVVQS